MLEIFTSSNLFFSTLVLLTIGAIGSLIFGKNYKLANFWGNTLAVLGSISGLMTAVQVFFSNSNFTFNLNSSLPLLSISFYVDKLSAFFIFAISLIALIASTYAFGYVKHYYKKYNIGFLGFFYNIFLAGMVMVVSAHNALFFLVVWEIMSLSSYFLVIFENKEEENVHAGSIYFIMTHIGTAFIILLFLLLYNSTGSLDFTVIKDNIGLVPPLVKNLVFIFALIGFGTKAGIIPLHVWLPSAHPAAPSHVSSLMSGVMIKTGIYMLIRIFMDILLSAPIWWGVVILILGAISSILGILYALTEHDIKRLLAYSSIENIGIILLGFGSSLIFWSLDMKAVAILALVAALFHTLNHSVFKSLLFLGAGSVISETHTRNMEEYGGLIKYMPQTAFFFLIGAMAISALPPFNGFFSEWLTFQSLFSGMLISASAVSWAFILAAGSLAFTGGLAAMCFVKTFGITFLARPRSEEIYHVKESKISLRIAMGLLALLILVIGFSASFITNLLSKVVTSLGIFKTSLPAFSSNFQSTNLQNNFSSVSMPLILISLVSSLVIIFIIVSLITKNRKIKYGNTWDCGTPLNSRMEITATGFSRSIISIFKGVLKPTKQVTIVYHDENMRYFQKSKTVELGISNVYQNYLYIPVQVLTTKISDQIKKIQSGNVNQYILYIFIALIAMLFISSI